MKWFSRTGILLLLVALIIAPPILTGYLHLARAQASPLPADASIEYESAARLLFWQPALYEEAGLLSTEDPSRAIRLFLAARRSQALSPAGQMALGDAYQAAGEQEKALSEWEKLMDDDDQAPAAAARLAPVYHAQQRYDAEQRVLARWLAIEPGNSQASEQMGILLAAAGDNRALPLLATAARASPANSARLDRLISALAVPDDPAAYRLALCGQALAQLGEWPLARQAFSLAIQADPHYASAWSWLGLARQQTGQPGALTALEYAISQDGAAGSHAMLGIYWQNLGEFQKAIDEYTLATRLEPANTAWWRALGGMQARSDLPAALNSYVHAANLAPQDAANWLALAAFCVENNAFLDEYGLNAALRAYALEPMNVTTMDLLGRAQMETGQYPAAESMLLKALAANPGDRAAAIHLHLALLYLRTRREATAKNEFELALRADPGGPVGAQAEKLLERYFP